MLASTQFLERDGGTLAFDLTGPEGGELVVCVPGIGDLRQSFRFLVPRLVQHGYRVATMDLRGHGESSTGWKRYDVDAIASDVGAIVAHLGGRAHLIGQSLGCAAVVKYAAALPGHVDRLVLLSTEAGTRRVNSVQKFIAKFVARRPRLWARYHRYQYPTSPPGDLNAYCKELAGVMRDAARRAALLALLDDIFQGVDVPYQDVRSPVLLVFGDRDRELSDVPAEAKAVEAQLLSPVETAFVAAGHYPQAEAPAETGTIVVEFLGSEPSIGTRSSDRDDRLDPGGS